MSEPVQPDALDRLWARFSATLAAPLEGDRRGLMWLLGGLVLLALPLLVPGSIFVNDKFLDLFVPLDGAHRMASGQWPHLDFYTPIGAAYYLLLWLASLVVGTGPRVVALAAFLPAPAFAAAAWWIGRRRLPEPLTLAAGAYLGLLAFSPRTLGGLETSFLATYNKHGWAAVGLVALWAVVRPETDDARADRIDAAIVVVATLFALYVKVTYFALAGALILVVFAFHGGRRRHAFAAGSAALALAGLGQLTPLQQGYVADLEMAAAAMASSEKSGLFRPERASEVAAGNQFFLAALALFVVWFLRSSRSKDELDRASLTVLWLLASAALCLLTTLQSHDPVSPALPVVGLGAFGVARARALQRSEGERSGLRAVAAAAFLLLAVPMFKDLVTLGTYPVQLASSIRIHPEGRLAGLRAPGLEGPSPLAGVVDGSMSGFEYDQVADQWWPLDNGPIYSDGLRLLREHDLTEARVVSLSFSSVFPWLLDAPPPRHFPAWLDYHRTFTDGDADWARRALSDTDVVLATRVGNMAGAWVTFGPVVQAEFERVDESPYWVLWVRR